jgi:hypothetical protein
LYIQPIFNPITPGRLFAGGFLFKTLTMNPKQQQRLISDMLTEMENRENEFPVIDTKGKFLTPILTNGVVKNYNTLNEPPKRFRGLVLEINDHGNITVWMYYKNGNIRELAGRV